MSGFVDWYNCHQHSGIDFHTPANVHFGHGAAVARERSETLAAARAKHPARFATTHDPKIPALLDPAWINQPKENTEKEAAQLPLVPFSLKNSAQPTLNVYARLTFGDGRAAALD